jgi:hypothetical protein
VARRRSCLRPEDRKHRRALLRNSALLVVSKRLQIWERVLRRSLSVAVLSVDIRRILKSKSHRSSSYQCQKTEAASLCGAVSLSYSMPLRSWVLCGLATHISASKSVPVFFSLSAEAQAGDLLFRFLRKVNTGRPDCYFSLNYLRGNAAFSKAFFFL